MRSLDLGYIAGLLDSDGFITMCNAGRKDKRIIRLISISQNCKHPRVLRDIKNTLNCGKICQSPSESKENKWTWRVSSKSDVIKICDALIPFSIIKKRQLQLIKESCKLRFGSFRSSSYAPAKEYNNILINEIKREHNNNEFIDLSITPKYSWIAGMIDGDGSLTFCVNKTRKYLQFIRKVSIIINNIEFAKKLAKMLNGFIKKDYYYNKVKPLVSVNITRRRDIKNLLLHILPYIQIKKERAAIMLASLEVRPKNKGKCNNFVYSSKEICYLHSLYERFKLIQEY